MNPSSSPRDFLLPLIFMVAGLFAFFHPTFLSNFAFIQTDPRDPRWNNYMLEHGYQWITGNPLHRSFWDLPIFFPTLDTASYSEILLAAAPVYWLFRLLGFLPDTAFQVWMVVMVALDFLAAFLLFRRGVGLSALAAAGGAYIFAYASMRANQLSAPQLLPQFFSVLAIFCVFRILSRADSSEADSPRNKTLWIALFAVSTVFQFYASFYLGFFLCFGLLVCFLVALFFREARETLWDAVRTHWAALLVSGLLSVLALSWMAYHYLGSQLVFGSRNWSEIVGMIPKPKSWINMGPGNWVYRWMRDYIDFSALPDGPQNRLGLGLVTFGIAAAGFIATFARPWVKVILIASLFIGSSALIYPWHWTPWETVSWLLPGAGAIRCVARVSLLLLIPISFGIALFLNGTHWKKLAVALLIVACVEQVYTTPSFSKYLIRSTVRTIVEQIPPGCKAFYYVTSVPEGGQEPLWDEYQLHAMWAQMMAGVATVNGFSGHIPPEWWPLWQPVLKTKEDFLKARLKVYKWAEENHVAPGEICVVPIFTAPLQGPEPDLANVELNIGEQSARPFLGDGWGDDEWDKDVSWVWALGTKASVYVALKPAAAYAMTVVAGPMEVPGIKQMMTVQLNGVPVARLEMAKGMRPYRIALPVEAIHEFNRIDFVFAHAVSPVSLGEATDSRKLAAAFERIAFSRSP